MYPVIFPGLGRGLDFLLPSFLVSRQDPYRGREVFLGTFSTSFMYPVIFPGLGRGLDFLLPSFLSSRKEKKVGVWGKDPDFYSPRSIYPENVSRFHDSLNMNTQNVTRLGIIRSLYPKNVSRFRHSSSLKWRPVGRMQYAPTRGLEKSIRFRVTR